jgi:tetratricopeptide (TPR) repeat protein
VPPSRWAAAVLGLAVTASALAGRRRFPALSGAWLMWAALLAPTAGLLQSGPQDTADRYTYLAGLPWALLFGAAAGRRPWAGLFLIPLTLLSWRQQSHWRTPESLWSRAQALDPASPYPPYNLGAARAARGADEEAVAHFRRALALNPTFEQALFGLAALDHRAGRLKAAEEGYRRVLRVNPGHARARRNLDKLISSTGSFSRAEREKVPRRGG